MYRRWWLRSLCLCSAWAVAMALAMGSFEAREQPAQAQQATAASLHKCTVSERIVGSWVHDEAASASVALAFGRDRLQDRLFVHGGMYVGAAGCHVYERKP